MRILLQYKRLWMLLLFPLGLLLTALAAFFPGVTERLYSRGLYRGLSAVFGRLSSLLPFSLAELLLLVLALALILYLIFGIAGIVRAAENRAEKAGLFLVNLLCAASLLYGLFVFVCGLNYHRETFAEYSGLEIRPSTAAELRALCEELVDAVNLAREKLPEDENGVCAPALQSHYETAKQAALVYQNVGKVYPILSGYTPRPKPVLLSRAMSYLNITGIYIPFTFECNVNVDVPAFTLPATMAHELAHFKGFMREQEANFIAYLACLYSGDDLFSYSGNYLAMIYSTNALYAADRDAYRAVMEKLSPGVIRDMQASASYWQQFETPIADAATAVNNTYLRANRQESGVKSYGEMVDLLLADYRSRNNIS